VSYEIIRKIRVYNNEVFLRSSANNVSPKSYNEWKCESLTRLLQEEGRDAMDLETFKEYENGNFQGGKNRYTRALKVLNRMPEYDKFDWREIPYDDNYSNARHSEEFNSLLRLALKTQLPKEKYIIMKQHGSGYVYLRKKGSRTAEWRNDPLKATVFRYQEEAESYKNRFSGSDNWKTRLLEKKKPMKLMTEEISKQAQEQYGLGADMQNQLIVAKFFDPCGAWSWYVMNQDPNDPDYLWGIVDGFEVEAGSFSLSELETVKGPLGIGIERDLYFTPLSAIDAWNRLQKGEHI
jgi:hypothetical protein